MADAGDYWFHALSNAGQTIGAAIEQEHQKRESVRQTDSMIDFFAKTPRDPTAPPGSPGSKPLVDTKTYEFLKGYMAQHKAAGAATVQAYMGMGEKLAFEGAKARMSLDQVRPIFGTDDQGNVRQVGERGPKGSSKFFPQWLVNPKAQPNPVEHALNTSAAKFGMNPEDVKAMSEMDPNKLTYLDDNHEKIGVPQGPPPTTAERLHLRKHQKFDKQEAKKHLRGSAKYVQGVVNGKKFMMPVDQFQRFKNMVQNQPQGNGQRQPGGHIVSVRTPDEARKLPPDIPLFRTPDGRVLKNPNYRGVGGGSQPQNMSADTSAEDDSGDESDNGE